MSPSALIALAGIFSIALAAQDRPKFDAVSVRALGSMGGSMAQGTFVGGPGTSDPERLTFQRAPLKMVLLRAFDVPRRDWSATDLVLGPDWIETERYEIDARVPPGTDAAQIGPMLKDMLAERFGLQARWENRTVSGYELVIAKGGPKLEESSDIDPFPGIAERMGRDKDGFPILPRGKITTLAAIANGRRYLTARNQTIADLICCQIGLPHVIDKTGLTGKYNFHLETANIYGPQTTGEPNGPDIFQALEKQLGLKLERKTVSYRAIIIDHVDRIPTPN